MLFDKLLPFMYPFLDFSGSFLYRIYKQLWILIALIDIPELFQSACAQSQGFRFFHTADPVSEIPRSIASMTPLGNLPVKTDIVQIVDMAPQKN